MKLFHLLALLYLGFFAVVFLSTIGQTLKCGTATWQGAWSGIALIFCSMAFGWLAGVEYAEDKEENEE